MKLDKWAHLNRWGTVFSIFSGTYLLITLIWGFAKIAKSGFTSSIPAWPLPLTAIAAFCLGWFSYRKYKHRKSKNDLKDLQRIDEIRFDYLPDSPEKHGWRITENQPGLSPITTFASDGPTPACLSISDRGTYAMDFDVPPLGRLADTVKLSVKFLNNSCFYLKIRISSRDHSQSRQTWLRFVIGNRDPEKFNNSEWTIYVCGQLEESGWISLNIFIPTEVGKTFGTEGWIFQELLGFRIRGSLSITPIAFHAKASTQVLGIPSK
jgi:hypothetical protein